MLAAALVALGWATVRRIEIFRSDLVLWQDVVTKRPNNPRGHDNLGLALEKNGKTKEAIAQFNAAIATGVPSAAHHHLANLLIEHDQPAAAIAEFQIADQSHPNDAEIKFFWGLALSRQEDIQGALKHWREAVEIEPSNSKYRYALAWVLATNRDPAVRNGREAVELAKRGVDLTKSNDAPMLDALAAAYAETGQFSQAVRTARRAIELATHEKNARVANAVRIHLHNYESGLAYHEP